MAPQNHQTNKVFCTKGTLRFTFNNNLIIFASFDSYMVINLQMEGQGVLEGQIAIVNPCANSSQWKEIDQKITSFTDVSANKFVIQCR